MLLPSRRRWFLAIKCLVWKARRSKMEACILLQLMMEEDKQGRIGYTLCTWIRCWHAIINTDSEQPRTGGNPSHYWPDNTEKHKPVSYPGHHPAATVAPVSLAPLFSAGREDYRSCALGGGVCWQRRGRMWIDGRAVKRRLVCRS